MLPFKTRRTSQPQGVGATVDKSSALGSLDWRLLFSGGGSVSGSANPTWPTPIGAGSVIGVGQAGRSIGINREKSGDYWSWGNNPQLKLDSMCGFCVFERGASATVGSSLFDTGITSDNNLGLGININADGTLHLNHQDHANLVITTSAPFKPGINVVAWRWDNVAGTGAIIYNGQKFTGATSPKTFTHGIASSCGYYSSPSGYANTACGIYMLGISSNGDIADSTLSRLHNEYLSLFKPQSRSLWIPGTVSGGGTTSATVTQSDSADTTSLTTTVTTGATIASSDGADAQAVAAANWMTAQLASSDGADTQAVAATAGGITLAGIAQTDGWDATAITMANWTAALIAHGDAPDTTAVTGNIVGVTSASVATMDAADTQAISTLVTTGAVIVGTDGADTALASAACWTTAIMAAANGADTTSIVGSIPGTAVYPLESKVLAGVQYGPTGADYTGTLTGGSGPSAADIAAAVRSDLATELAQLTKVSKLHGIGVDLVVTPTSRTAGSVAQTISTSGDSVTVSAA